MRINQATKPRPVDAKPRLGDPKPGLGHATPRLGDLKPRLGVPKVRLRVPKPRLVRGCPVDSPNRVAWLKAPKESPVEATRLAPGC